MGRNASGQAFVCVLETPRAQSVTVHTTPALEDPDEVQGSSDIDMDMDVEVEDESDHSDEFVPDSEEEGSSYDSDSDEEQHAAHESDKFIVFDEQLEQLLRRC